MVAHLDRKKVIAETYLAWRERLMANLIMSRIRLALRRGETVRA